MPGPSDWLAIGCTDARWLAALEQRLRRLGWRRAHPAHPVWVSADHPLPVRQLGAGLLLGRYAGHFCAPLPGAPATLWAETLMQGGWGQWITLLPEADGVTVTRDPSGALDAFVWRHGRLWIAAADAYEGLDDLLPSAARIDIGRLALVLRHAAAVSGAAIITDIQAVTPGAAVRLPPQGEAIHSQIWSPARVAAREPKRRPDPTELRTRVDTVVDALVRPHQHIIGEVSGGFDSAVIATSAAAQGLGSRVSSWLNFHAREAEGDERSWARAVARRAGLCLTERRKRPRALTVEALERLTLGLRPALQGLDVEYDAQVAEEMTAMGATGLLTGQGGDAVFFQFGTPAVVIDRVRRLGLAGLDPAYVHRIARWTRVPAWRLLERAARDRLGWPAPPDPEAAPSPAAAVHPWLADLDSIPSAKRGQIRQLVNAQIFHGDCLRRRAGELLHPLLSQPLMEAGLAIPADVLVEGGRDRDLARRLFADRLPPEVLHRRGKGELSTYYGEVVRQSLPVAHELLVDGDLVSSGLLDPDDVRASLDPAHLIADGAYNDVLIRMVLELWVRRWRARLARRPKPLVEPGEDPGV